MDVVCQLGILLAKRRHPLRALVSGQLERLVQAQARRTPSGGIHLGHVARRDPIRGGRKPVRPRGSLWHGCSAVTLQKRQRLLIEFCDILVEWRVRAPFENEELGIADAAL